MKGGGRTYPVINKFEGYISKKAQGTVAYDVYSDEKIKAKKSLKRKEAEEENKAEKALEHKAHKVYKIGKKQAEKSLKRKAKHEIEHHKADLLEAGVDVLLAGSVKGAIADEAEDTAENTAVNALF